LSAIGFDFDADACASHKANGHVTVRADLDEWAWRPMDMRLLWASPPCQPFSSAGDRRGADDARDGMPAFLRAVEALLPPVVVMENVPGLINKKHLGYRSMFTNALLRCGYDYQWRILNCADYGVPQTRERFILIARRDGERIRWPVRSHSESGVGVPRWVTMAEALGLPDGWMVNTGRDWKPGGTRAEPGGESDDRRGRVRGGPRSARGDDARRG
jgi:site-specific DNA-cytosine methylase